MTKSEYKKALQDQRWKDLRIVILKRDNYACVKCNAKENLHVHHIKYINGKQPWQVPNSLLQTLCQTCHIKVHKNKPISDFVLKNKKVKKSKIKKKVKKNNIQNLKSKLSPRDKALQERYDKFRNN